MSAQVEKPAKGLVARVDDAFYLVERRVASTLFLVLGLVVFADVLHRVFSREDGRIAHLVGRLLGGRVSPEIMNGRVAPALIILATFGLFYAAIRTRRPDPGRQAPSPRRAALWALAGTAVATGAVRLFIYLLPSGLVWAPYFALSLMLWVGFIGASMATYKRSHLALEMGEKIWPESVKRYVQALARFVTAGACLGGMALTYISVSGHYALAATSSLTDVIPSLEWPKWAVFVILPFSFLTMGLRFLRQSIDLLRGKDAGGGGDVLPGLPAQEEEVR